MNEAHKVSSYITGYILAIILSVIPFYLVMGTDIHSCISIPLIIIFAMIQVMVHIRFFLNLRYRVDQTWNWIALIYTFLLLCIIMGASVWIMYHLNYNMMSTHNSIESKADSIGMCPMVRKKL